MTQLHERDATASVRPVLPHVETSGFEILAMRNARSSRRCTSSRGR